MISWFQPFAFKWVDLYRYDAGLITAFGDETLEKVENFKAGAVQVEFNQLTLSLKAPGVNP